jgi:predicted outer membrane lipoprotein
VVLTLSGLSDFFVITTPRVLASSNPGLKLANAFGVTILGLKLANAFGVKRTAGLKLANAFGVKRTRLIL